MGSVLSRVGKGKQRSSEVQLTARDKDAGLDVDAKVERIRGLIPLGLMQVHELLDNEVVARAGRRHWHNDGLAGMRHGSDPGSVRRVGDRGQILGDEEPILRAEWVRWELRARRTSVRSGPCQASLSGL